MGVCRRIASALLWLGVILVGGAAAAEEITDPTKPQTPPPEAKAGAGVRPSPFTLTAAYTADFLGDVSGGADPGTGFVDLIKLSASYDGAAGGHRGLTGLVSIEHANGADFTAARVGGFQEVSSLETQPAALRLYEVWLQWEILHGRGGVKAGLVDINTTFDVQETAALFINASHGLGAEIGDTGENGPSDYPTTALAVTGSYRPAEGWTAQLGVFDGVAGDPHNKGAFVAIQLEGALIVAQVEKRFGDIARMEAGAWSYTAAFPSLDQFGPGGVPRSVHGDAGVYGLIEGRLATKPGDDAGGLSGWIRAGLANGHINPVQGYLGAGLVYTGLIKGRDKDEAGLAVARASFGPGARYAGAQKGRTIGQAETDFEATYRYVFKDWLNIQPDAQWVIHPHGDLNLPNALVLGVRLAFTFTR